MAYLSEQDRRRVWRGLMRHISKAREPIAVSKAELMAAVEATDAWIDDNQGAYNLALPFEARTGLTTGFKTLMFCAAALMRVDIAFLRQVLGEVD